MQSNNKKLPLSVAIPIAAVKFAVTPLTLFFIVCILAKRVIKSVWKRSFSK